MKANRKADLQRKLTLRVVPTPPDGLAERIKSDIPKHLPTATELDRRRLSSAIAFNMRVAASVLLLIGSLFFALHLLNRAYQQEDAHMASFNDALKSNSAPGRADSPLPKPQRSEPQVVTSTEQPPMVVAPPQPAIPLLKQRQEARGRVLVAEADNGPAEREELGRRQKLARDERLDARMDNRKGNEQKTKEESTAANELKDAGSLDKTQRAGAGAAANGFDRAPDTTVAGRMGTPAAAPGSKPVAVPAAQPAAPPPPAEAYYYSHAAAPAPPAPAKVANAAHAPKPAPPAPATVESLTVTAEAPMLSEARASHKKAAAPASDFIGTAQADLPIGRPSTLFGYALAGQSLEAAPLVQRFTSPETRPGHGLRVEASAAPAPLDATRKVLRVSIDSALVSGEAGATPVAIAGNVQWEVDFDPAAVVSHRAVTGEPAKSEHTMAEGVSVTALYELELKPSLPPDTRVAMVHLHYRSLSDGHEQTIEREVSVHDIAASWDVASARTKRAALAAAFAEAHARGADTTAIVAKARAMGFDALAALARGSS